MSKDLEKLNKRQDEILSVLGKGEGIFIAEIINRIKSVFKEVSKITVNRDLQKLIDLGFVEHQGKGRATVYNLSPHFWLIKPVDVEKYFKIEINQRTANEKFEFGIFNFLKDIFTVEEKRRLNKLNNEYTKNIKSISESLLKKEFERLVIELSWKSSQIEGNTYTLLETEALIKEQKEARGHKKEEAIMILNHKNTIDYIRKNKNKFKNISVPKIEDIHYLLTKDLRISRNIRKRAVGITGTKYRPLDNQFQIKEALEMTCRLINAEKDFFTKSLLLSIMIAYIQPFEDGNKRTSRLISNAILMAYGVCPLSYRSVDETEYKKAVILFYEQNNISYFKQMFIEQFEFAVNNYFMA